MGEQSEKLKVLPHRCCQDGAILPVTGLAVGSVAARR